MMLFGLGLGDTTPATTTGIPGVDEIINYVRNQAQSGAEGAIPEIQAQVKMTIQPYIITIGLMAGLGLLLGLAALSKVNKLGERSA